MTSESDEVFGPEELAATDPRIIEHLLTSRGYTELLEPLLIGLIQRFYNELADPSIKRRWDKPDNYLRGGIRVAKAILNYPQHVLAVQRREFLAEEEARKEAKHYEDASHGGQYGRSSAPISPTDPIQ